MSSEKEDLCGEKSRAGLLVFRLSKVYDVKAGICKASRKRVSPRKERRRMTESEKVDAPCRGGVLDGRKRIEKERGCPQLTGCRSAHPPHWRAPVRTSCQDCECVRVFILC